MGFLDFIPLVGKIIDKIIPDPAAKAEAQFKLLQLAQSTDLAQLDAEVKLAAGQLDINKVEAASGSLFVSGARPFVIWVCGIGLGFQFIFAPVGTWITALAGHPTPFPSLDGSTLLTVLGSLLGLGGMRTVEKLNGVASK